MIHEVDRKILSFMRDNISKEDIITFDDGLYSQYRYWHVINDMFKDNRKIFFISTDAVRDGAPAVDIVKCEEAMRRWVEEGSRKHYMSWIEIRAIHEDGGEIGSHGHGHYYSFGNTLEEQVKNFKADIMEMEYLFKMNLGHVPKSYARPFNKKQPVEKPILGDVEIFGDERYDIREAMGEPGYDSNYKNFKSH